MAERKRIGINYTYNENWIGGTYYIENLVRAINSLADERKPHLVIITSDQKAFDTFILHTGYPYASFQLESGESNITFKWINKIVNRLFKKKPINQVIKNLEAVFPYYDCVQYSDAVKKVFWIPDFQYHFYPHFFTQIELQARNKATQEVAESELDLILSSEDASKHFQEIHPDAQVKTHILPFAVSLPNFSKLNIESVKQKFKINGKYYISPNQFWQHKNHKIVLEAVALLKKEGYQIDFTIIFTGKTHDYRNPDYYNILLAFINENDLAAHVKFLGFIDRKEQLCLIKHASAVIQPSLFEGWSTVIEDAKALNKMVIASNLAVNQEQLVDTNAIFFEPSDSVVLANILAKRPLPDHLYHRHTYHQNIEHFGNQFLNIVNV